MAERFIDTDHFLWLQRVRGFARTGRGVTFDVDEEKFRVDVLRADVLRLKISHAGRFDEAPTFAAAFAEPEPGSVPFEVRESELTVTIETERMKLLVTKAPFRFDAFRSDGSVIFEGLEGREGPEGYLYLNDRFIVSRRIGQFDSVYGLGEKSGSFERRGRQFVLYNYDVLSNALRQNRLQQIAEKDAFSPQFDPYYISIPFFYHCMATTRQANVSGFFVDNGYRGYFDFIDPHQFRYQFEGGQYTEYVFAGPEMRQVLEAYTWVTGRMRPPPIYSLGFHQCRWHDYDQKDILAIGAEYRARQIPCDVLWLDIQYMDGFRVFTWDKAKFPDVSAMLTEMREKGFRCITIIDPGVKYEPGYPVFDEGRDQNLFCKTEEGQIFIGIVWPGGTAFPDFFKQETRSWWGRLNAEHVASGLAGIWNDMNEPATGPVEPFSMRFDRDGANYSHERYHNQYALLMAMGTHDGLRRARPNERTFILSRAGFAGIQRYAANWLGDNASRWDHLEMSLPMAAGLGISGQPFVGADIPGFAQRPSGELMVRWMQYGTLTPFARGHNCAGMNEQYPWSFGPGVERACRSAIGLRYRLIPYIYTAFLRACHNGEPVQRPLIFDFQNDRHARETEDQYLLGPALLVAPILRAGLTARHVYLPEGSWVHFHTGETYGGGQYCTVQAPLEYTPFFVRGGSVVPAYPQPPQTTMNHYPETIDLLLAVPSQDGEFISELAEDDGLTFGAEAGAHYRSTFKVSRSGKRLRLRATVDGHGFPEFQRQRFRLVFLNGTPLGATLDGRPIQIIQGRAEFENRAVPFELIADLP